MEMIKVKTKLYGGILLIIMTFTLVGCITIPIGNEGVITISGSGIDYTKKSDSAEPEKTINDDSVSSEDEGKNGEDNEVAINFDNEVIDPLTDNGTDQDANSKQPSPESDDTVIKKEPKKKQQDEKNKEISDENSIKYKGEPDVYDDCNYDYSEFTDYLPVDIYIPYCGILLGVAEFSNFVSSSFLVDFVSYDDILYNYRTFLGLGRDEYFNTDELREFAPKGHASFPALNRTVLIRGELQGGGELVVIPEQRNGYVHLILEYRW